jgi:hypothetical protein
MRRLIHHILVLRSIVLSPLSQPYYSSMGCRISAQVLVLCMGKLGVFANKAFARLLHVTNGTKGVRFDGCQAHQATAGCRMGTIWTIDLTRLVGVAPTGILRGHSTSRFLSNLLAGLTSNDRIV